MWLVLFVVIVGDGDHVDLGSSKCTPSGQVERQVQSLEVLDFFARVGQKEGGVLPTPQHSVGQVHTCRKHLHVRVEALVRLRVPLAAMDEGPTEHDKTGRLGPEENLAGLVGRIVDCAVVRKQMRTQHHSQTQRVTH